MTRAVSLLFLATLVVLTCDPPAPAEQRALRLSVVLSSTTVRQGETLQVVITSPAPTGRPTVRFGGRLRPVYPVGERRWLALLGTDPTTPPGRTLLRVQAAIPNGTVHVAQHAVTVVRVAFPQRRLTFDPDRASLLTPEQVARERARVNAALRVLSPRRLWTGSFDPPLDAPVSSPYGVLSIYQGTVRGFHGGTDFAAAEGEAVRAVADGIVRLAETLPLSGNAVMVDHGLGVVSSYLHLSSIDVRVGHFVRKGDPLGRVGSTGLATGPHLHLGLRVNGVRVDPMHWIGKAIVP